MPYPEFGIEASEKRLQDFLRRVRAGETEDLSEIFLLINEEEAINAFLLKFDLVGVQYPHEVFEDETEISFYETDENTSVSEKDVLARLRA